MVEQQQSNHVQAGSFLIENRRNWLNARPSWLFSSTEFVIADGHTGDLRGGVLFLQPQWGEA